MTPSETTGGRYTNQRAHHQLVLYSGATSCFGTHLVSNQPSAQPQPQPQPFSERISQGLRHGSAFTISTASNPHHYVCNEMRIYGVMKCIRGPSVLKHTMVQLAYEMDEATYILSLILPWQTEPLNRSFST
jgi:hypothetical protein